MQDERARAEVLAALEAVDLVVIFEEDTPIELITQIKPSVLVKGGDYTREQVVGHEIVEAGGGEVRAGRYPARLQHDLAGRPRARRRGVNVGADNLRGRSGAAGLARSGGLGQDRGYRRGSDRAGAAMVDVAGRHLRGRMGDRGGADARSRARSCIAEAADLRAADRAVRAGGGRNAVVGRAHGARGSMPSARPPSCWCCRCCSIISSARRAACGC